MESESPFIFLFWGPFKMAKIKWVEPRIVNMEKLPTTLGACTGGSSAIEGGGCTTGGNALGTGGGGLFKCEAGSTAGKNQCNSGNIQS